MKTYTLIFLGFILLLFSCKKVYNTAPPLEKNDWLTKNIEASPQSLGGDPQKGFDYLINGSYLGSGIPYDLVKIWMKNPEKLTERADLNTPHAIATFYTEDSIRVVNGTCFSCHAGRVNDVTVLGMGNSRSNNQWDYKLASRYLGWRARSRYKKDSTMLQSFDDFGKYFEAMAPYIETNNPVVSPAARIAESCMRFRNPIDLTYNSIPQYPIREYNLAADIPALWHMQKKNALYYTGVGRGDFTKLLFQASVLGIKDSTAARLAQQNFEHITAWIRTIEPPKYPKEINTELVKAGKLLFQKKCQSCHGTYDYPETYPNKIVSLDVVKTDPLYAAYAVDSKIVQWYNKSWFATSEPQSWFEPEQGYMAPPLDGVWSTAPYLHNGSIPTIYNLLNSKTRPKYWKRSDNTAKYDWEKVGWENKYRGGIKDHNVYDTSLPGYGNQGHTFADDFTETERMAVIEYLKTL